MFILHSQVLYINVSSIQYIQLFCEHSQVYMTVNRVSSHPSSPVQCEGHSEGMAGEESSLAGAVRRAQRDDGEHPGHCHPLLHGHEGEDDVAVGTVRLFLKRYLSSHCRFFLLH